MTEAVAVRDEWMARLYAPDLTYPEFEQLCFMLGRVHEAVRFAIGDAILLGVKHFGDDAYQAFEALNLSEDARREYVRVAERVPRSLRRKDLSWSHHRAVAALAKPAVDGTLVPDRAAQKEWLARASDEGLSHQALRDALRNGSEPEPVRTCRCCHRAFDD